MWRYLVVLVGVLGFAVVGPDIARKIIASPQVSDAVSARQERAESPRKPAGGIRTLVLDASSNGHYFTTVWINGRAVDAVIDTGATTIAIPEKIAAASGVIPRASDYTARTRTANGIVRAAPVDLREVRLGSIRLRNVRAMVLPDGALGITLIGMTALSKLSTIDIRDGRMRLVQ
ncbi:TIGR02281 family clan AA aspartic protease [Stappia sp. GBMRC 2046]|uniref:TIGR02281 family clan AA aspartic protease n=1 Tax=Stappia sediminis TaxID=2692190 RepID=A0A7X3S924_9HYPH|nr:TIGR02281 family clan AA aspartic protease [Stappia sediminis]MXN66433.1 TIGR02281 family clan AA aspartic protease [Stappia sediminis]